MSLNMLRREVGEDECIHLYESVTVEEGALRSHFHDYVLTVVIHGLPDDFLHEETTWHAHLVEIVRGYVTYLETDRIRYGSFVSSFFEDCIQDLDG